MAEFISVHGGITYKIPDSDKKYARFSGGRFSTQDEEVADYLRQHPDYGVTLTEIENPTRTVAISPGVYICKNCGAAFKTSQQYAAHCRVCGKNEEGE